MNDRTHEPVLVAEVLALVPAGSRIILDCTIGGGGHAEAILRQLGDEVELIGFDRDEDALTVARQRLAGSPNRVTYIHDSYANVDRQLGKSHLGSVDFALLDAGLSSLQLEHSGRGFSFQSATDPLDLRFDGSRGDTLAMKLTTTTPDELTSILRTYGEISRAKPIAVEIVAEVENQSLTTVKDLVRVISRHIHGEKRNQFLAKVWQALRIWVNDELSQLQTGLESIVKYLRPGGVVAAISFHSLEDRIVKDFMNNQENPCVCPREFPRCVCGRKATLERITRKPIKPTAVEIARNSRARSARLRAARKLA